MKTRREIVLGTAALIVPRHVLGGQGFTAPSDRIRVGVIGMGNRSGLLVDQLPDSAQVVSAADCFVERCEAAAAKRQAKWRIHQDYRRLLEDREVDGVIVGTTDHARVLACIHACQAGKDIYAEKPLTLYIAEGRTLVQFVRKHNRILQVGSQQRSMAMNQVACAFVRNGGLGKLHFVQGVNYPSPKPVTPLPEETAPATLNWDMWLHQSPLRPYSRKLHLSWMQWRDYSGFEMTNWGAHGLDQIQMALGTDETGPVELWPLADSAPGAIGFRYANGALVRLEVPHKGRLGGGAIFLGENGRIEIFRNGFQCEPSNLIKDLPPQEEVVKWDRAQWQAKYHMQEWLDCMRTRKRPSADVEIGHRSVSLGHLANITRELNRKLRWDPAAEQFMEDAEANAMVNRPRRRGYELPAL